MKAILERIAGAFAIIVGQEGSNGWEADICWVRTCPQERSET